MVNTRWRLLGMLFVACLLTAACEAESDSEAGPSPNDEVTTGAELYPVFASSELVVGENRFLVGLLDDNDAPISSPDIAMQAAFFFGEEEDPRTEVDMDFIWIEKPLRGLYAGTVDFAIDGQWTVELDIEGEGFDSTLRSGFPVLPEPMTPAIGERPPTSDTPTADDVKRLSEITTDHHPDPDFYRVSIADALESGEPFVVVFATPEFCATQACGPMLDIVKSVADEFPKMTFIHVEPYDLEKTPEQLIPIKAALEWGLPSEPWTFVVDGKGLVAAKFEGVLSARELREALDSL